MDVSILHLKSEYGARTERRFAFFYFLHHVVPLYDGKCRFTMLVAK